MLFEKSVIMEWTWLKDWWRLKKWRNSNRVKNSAPATNIQDVTSLDTQCYCDECFVRYNNVLANCQASHFILYKNISFNLLLDFILYF